ncbi:hypothetical protein SANTM175S_11046 [Streptomyces antimycoticus]
MRDPASAPPPRSSSRRRSTAWRTPSPRPAPRSRRAWRPTGGGSCARPRRRRCWRTSLGETGDEATGVAVVRQCRRRAAALDRRERRPRGLRHRLQGRRARQGPRLRRGRRASTATWSRPASSTRSRTPTRSALENAASIASLLLTTETLVVEKPAGGRGRGRGPRPRSRPRALTPRRFARSCLLCEGAAALGGGRAFVVRIQPLRRLRSGVRGGAPAGARGRSLPTRAEPHIDAAGRGGVGAVRRRRPRPALGVRPPGARATPSPAGARPWRRGWRGPSVGPAWPGLTSPCSAGPGWTGTRPGRNPSGPP